MSRVPTAYVEKFDDLTSKTYVQQAKWWLNGFWADQEAEAEKIWGWCLKFQELDQEKGKEGNDLDEFKAHIFLESLGETLTALDLRAKLREIDIDQNKRMALIEYLIFKYNKDVAGVCDAPQGGENKEEIEQASVMVEDAQTAVEAMQKRLQAQKEDLEASEAAEKKAKEAEEVVRAAEAEAKKAADENQAALAELHAQEEAYETKIKELTAKAETGGVVSRGRAQAELEQMKSEDPLPLRRAKINQEASVRKSNKAQKKAQEATAAAVAATKLAEDARTAAEESTAQAEIAVEECLAKMEEALAFLEKAKNKREIEEKKKYLPKHIAEKM